jgi:L-threonylcarbamoyladenylate synthase
MASPWQLRRAAAQLRAGGIVAYPTEAVFGLGCDPDNGEAVQRLLDLKGRAASKGLILIAAELSQLRPFIGALPQQRKAEILASWPGPITWIVPAAAHTPRWLTGDRDTLAVRVTAHPLAAALCRAAGMALVSTSANRSGQPPARTPLQVRRRLSGDLIDHLLAGRCGSRRQPTTIKSALSGQVLRR